MVGPKCKNTSLIKNYNFLFLFSCTHTHTHKPTLICHFLPMFQKYNSQTTTKTVCREKGREGGYRTRLKGHFKDLKYRSYEREREPIRGPF